MGVDSVNGGMAYTSYVQSTLLQSTQNIGSAQDTDGDSDKGKVGGKQGGVAANPFMNSVMQTLNQLGIAPTLQPNAPQAAGSAANTGSENTLLGDNKDNQALPAFMYSLVQALNQNAQGTQTQAAGSTASTTDTYGNLSANLQNLLQSLNSNTSGTNTSTSQLNSAFQHLVETLTGGSGSTTGGLTSLSEFLQTLVQNLPNSQGTNESGVGAILSTTA